MIDWKSIRSIHPFPTITWSIRRNFETEWIRTNVNPDMNPRSENSLTSFRFKRIGSLVNRGLNFMVREQNLIGMTRIEDLFLIDFTSNEIENFSDWFGWPRINPDTDFGMNRNNKSWFGMNFKFQSGTYNDEELIEKRIHHAFFPSISAFFPLLQRIFFFNEGLSTSAQYINVHQYTVRRVAIVLLSNRQRIVKTCKKLHCLLAKLSHSHHRESTCLLHKYRVIIFEYIWIHRQDTN